MQEKTQKHIINYKMTNTYAYTELHSDTYTHTEKQYGASNRTCSYRFNETRNDTFTRQKRNKSEKKNT